MKEEKNRKKSGLRKRIRVIFVISLILYTVFVLLDAFVIPSGVISVDEMTGPDSGNGRPGISRPDYKPVVTENSYRDGNIFIELKSGRWLDTTYYVADVKIADPSLLKVGLAGDSFGRNVEEVTSDIAERNHAVFAINGDYYGFRTSGYVLRNGMLYRSESNTSYPYGEDLVIWEDGSLEIIEEGAFTAEELQEWGAQQIFSFGPALVNHGEVKVVEDEEVERAQITNPRTAIGMIEPLHYIMVVSDGRTDESLGLSLFDLGNLMQDLGCDVAYNLDGGGSSTFWFNGKVLNKPTTYGDVIQERLISDIVYIGY